MLNLGESSGSVKECIPCSNSFTFQCFDTWVQQAGREGIPGNPHGILAPGHAVFDQSAYDCIKAFSETDVTDDLKRIDVPTLILHGDDDPNRADRVVGADVGEIGEAS